jgi:hypothetical protein
MMNPLAHRTGHRLIDVVVLRRIFGRETLNAVSGFGAAVHEQGHAVLNKRRFARGDQLRRYKYKQPRPEPELRNTG